MATESLLKTLIQSTFIACIKSPQSFEFFGHLPMEVSVLEMS